MALDLPKPYRAVLWIQVVYSILYGILQFGLPTITIRLVISDEAAIESNQLMTDALVEFFRYLGGAFFMLAVVAYSATRAKQLETMQLAATASLTYFVPSMVTNLNGMLFVHDFALSQVMPPFIFETTFVLSHASWLWKNHHRGTVETGAVDEATPLQA